MEQHFCVDVEKNKVPPQHPRAVELIELWICTDFYFFAQEMIDTYRDCFNFDGPYSLVFNSLGGCSVVGYMGAWIEKLI